MKNNNITRALMDSNFSESDYDHQKFDNTSYPGWKEFLLKLFRKYKKKVFDYRNNNLISFVTMFS